MMLTKTILDLYWDGKLPVDVISIAKNMGIIVKEDSSLEVASGVIRRLQDNNILITVNKNEPLVRQRFTVAHEIGHLALEHLNDEYQQFRDTSDLFTMDAEPKEKMANEFAAELLMPADAIFFVINTPKVASRYASSLEDLALLFGVTKNAMMYRFENLGIFKSI